MTNQTKHKAQTISGLRWSVLDQIINQITVFGVGYLLMQLLPPSSFGLLGMVTVFSGFLSVFKDFGIGSSLIQKKNITKLETNTVYWFTLLLGLFLTVGLYLLSPLIARYYEEPSLTKIARVISIIFLIQSMSSVQLSLMRKQMLFKQIFIVQVSSNVLSGLAALVLAYNGFGVWALVFQQIINSATLTTLIFLGNRYVPEFVFKKESLNEHLNFSLPLVARGAMNYWSRNADNFFIGSNLGTELLGIYTRAYSFMMLPISRISGVISSVMFPSLAQIQDEKIRVEQIFLKMARVISHITFPLMMIIALSSKSLIRALFSEEWQAMADILPMLAVIGALQSIGTLNGNIFLVKNRTVLAFQLNLMNSIVYITGFYFSSHYGLQYVVSVYLISNILLMSINWYFVAQLLGITFGKLIGNVLFSVVTFLLVYIIGTQLISLNATYFKDFQVILLCLLGVPFAWVLLNLVYNKPQIFELLTVVKQFTSKSN